MATQTLEKIGNQRFGAIERAIEELRDELEEQSRYMAAFLKVRSEKKISLDKLIKKYQLKRPR